MSLEQLNSLTSQIEELQLSRAVGRVLEISQNTLWVAGLSDHVCVRDSITVVRKCGTSVEGEVLVVTPGRAKMLLAENVDGIRIGDRVLHSGSFQLSPSTSWIGRVIDPFGQPLDGRKLHQGPNKRPIHGAPPSPTKRKALGERMETGLAVFNTLLPIVRGQRMGLFAGSGVGKSTLLSQLAKGMSADVVIIALVGERGREVREFIENGLGKEGLDKAVLIAATSDQSPLTRRKCVFTAMTVAEYFRDLGLQVLLLVDSITRFAEAHREVALAAGEDASLRGYPASMSHAIMSLSERAGPGKVGDGDITAIFTVLVAGSNMEEPIADIMRGVLDGHVILDREIAERGRYPAVDLLRSVSRSLPSAANDNENKLIQRTRQLLGAYERSEAMIQAGLYAKGSDPLIDEAISIWPTLDEFIGSADVQGIENSFEQLRNCIGSTME
ncbi:FliI/YscN family ATPase [Halocynthiibacter sp. C4]|uniref:FliI/YscN family ATPase n=1 Tax=Halocynthiibacter sp. C4 TaxID=2992758 RepID=UPI00237B2AFC|nr:FliI/YscN family ATPase [Halocynthiibacter sp. C4]MDE0591360.1 FliI/YscN family ATPase [Halocynthiibacter sp. C4]